MQCLSKNEVLCLGENILNIFTNRKNCAIIVVPNNLNIHSYRFFSLWNIYSFFSYKIKQIRFGKNATPA